MTAAAKRTLASPPARLRWRHGTARTRHDGHRVETPQGHALHGRVKAEPAATSFLLFPGTGRKRRGFSPPSSSAPDFCQGIRHAADFGSCFPNHFPQNATVKPPAGRFIRYTQHIAGQPTGQDMLNTIADQVHFQEQVPPRFRSVCEWRRPGAAAVRRRDG